EEQRAFALSKAQTALKEAKERCAKAQTALSDALSLLPVIEPGRQKAVSLQRVWAAKEKVESARHTLIQAQRQETLALQQHQEALRKFTTAAQSRIVAEK